MLEMLTYTPHSVDLAKPRPLRCFVPDILTPASLLLPLISSSRGEFRLTSLSHLSRGLPTGLLPWNFQSVTVLRNLELSIRIVDCVACPL